MSLQGSSFMMTRDKYWELLGDSKFPSWGSQGIEVACTTWLSGGKVICNKKTWYAHMFRTQGGDFSFPYQQHQSEVERAKLHAKNLFLGNRWPKQIYPLSWLVERFKPLHGNKDPNNSWVGWHDPEAKETLDRINKAGQKFYSKKENSKGIVFCTDNQLNLKIARLCQKQLKSIGLPIVSASLKPMDFGKNIYIEMKRGYEAYFTQILAALEASDANIIFMCEHDCLYPPEHFDFMPKDKDTFYYNQNWWKVHDDGVALHWDADQVSGLCAYKQILIDFYRERLKTFKSKKFDRKFEPISGHGSKSWKSSVPYIDIRHSGTLTFNKRSLADFRDKRTAVNFEESTIDKIPGWSNLDKMLKLD